MPAKRMQQQSLERKLDHRIAEETHNWAEQVRSLQKTYASIATAYDKLNPNDPVALLNWLKKIEARSLPTNLGEVHTKLLDELRQDVNALMLAFDGNFRDEVQRRGWRVDGQWPLYYLEYVLRLEVSDQQQSVRVGDRQVGTVYLPEVVAAVEEQLHAIAVERIDVDEFLAELSAAYDEVATEDRRQASIWHVYKQFLIRQQRPTFWRTGRTSAFRPYEEQKFRAALTKALQRERVLAPDGRELRVFPPIKAEDGMFLYLPVEGRHAFIGRVELVRAVQEAM